MRTMTIYAGCGGLFYHGMSLLGLLPYQGMKVFVDPGKTTDRGTRQWPGFNIGAFKAMAGACCFRWLTPDQQTRTACLGVPIEYFLTDVLDRLLLEVWPERNGEFFPNIICLTDTGASRRFTWEWAMRRMRGAQCVSWATAGSTAKGGWAAGITNLYGVSDRELTSLPLSRKTRDFVYGNIAAALSDDTEGDDRHGCGDEQTAEGNSIAAHLLYRGLKDMKKTGKAFVLESDGVL